MHRRGGGVPALALLLAVFAASCRQPERRVDETPGRTEPSAGGWKTWVLAGPSQIKVDPPPSAGSAAAALEQTELAELALGRTVEIRGIVERWNQSPPFKPWTELNLELVAARPKDPVAASRGYAYTHVAIYDAVVSAWHWKQVYKRPGPEKEGALVAPEPDPSYPSEHAAIAGAASRVLAYLFPERPAPLFEAMAEEVAESRVRAGANLRSDVEAGLALGRAVGDLVVERAKADGSDRQWDGNRPRGPGFWDPPPGSTALPVQPLAGSWETWVLSSGSEFRPPPPPEFGSPKFLEECQEIIEIRKRLTDEQKRIAVFWAGGQGTSLPPGVWNEVTMSYVRERLLTTPRAARVFALGNVAMADAGVAAWDAKYAYWNPRPENAIRDLGLDPEWKPFLDTPFFPAYVSGHSTYSGAIAEVMAYLFPEDAALFRTKAGEAGISRLYGGIHYRSDNVAGLELGKKVGERVIQHARADGAGPPG
ncbi:MAG: phosphatase PAP2 family protein [Actinomycetota bacterium]